jgi:hypothetical protein
MDDTTNFMAEISDPANWGAYIAANVKEVIAAVEIEAAQVVNAVDVSAEIAKIADEVKAAVQPDANNPTFLQNVAAAVTGAIDSIRGS